MLQAQLRRGLPPALMASTLSSGTGRHILDHASDHNGRSGTEVKNSVRHYSQHRHGKRQNQQKYK